MAHSGFEKALSPTPTLTISAATVVPGVGSASDVATSDATGPAGSRPRPQRFRKVLVAGLGRSGTSAIASFLKLCGFVLGNDSVDARHESPARRQLLLERRYPQLLENLQLACSEHAQVAWKDPKLHTAGAAFINSLPQDWLVIAVFRDAVAIAQRREISDGVPFNDSLRHCIEHQAVLHKFVLSTNKQVLPVSYERLMTGPLAVMNQMLDCLDREGLPTLSLDEVWAGMQKDRLDYREAHARPASGTTGGSP